MMNKYLIGIIVILLISISATGYILKKQIKERQRWEGNYKAAEMRYTDQSGLEAVRQDEVRLTIRELKHSKDSAIKALYEQSKVLNKKARQIAQLLSVSSNVNYDTVYIPIRDTVLITKKDTVYTRLASYEDKWLSASIYIYPEKIMVADYESRDNIIVSIGWHKNKRFFISRWFEKKKWDATVKSMNPNSRISHVTNINLKER